MLIKKPREIGKNNHRAFMMIADDSDWIFAEFQFTPSHGERLVS